MGSETPSVHYLTAQGQQAVELLLGVVWFGVVGFIVLACGSVWCSSISISNNLNSRGSGSGGGGNNQIIIKKTLTTLIAGAAEAATSKVASSEIMWACRKHTPHCFCYPLVPNPQGSFWSASSLAAATPAVMVLVVATHQPAPLGGM